MRYKGVLASSSDPTGETLSTTVRGAIISFSAIITLVVAHVFHVELSANDVTQYATSLGEIAGAGMMVYGLIMKLVNKTGTTS